METNTNPNLNMEGFSVKRARSDQEEMIYSATFYNGKGKFSEFTADKDSIFVYNGDLDAQKYFEVLSHLCMDANRGFLSESDLIDKLTEMTAFTPGVTA